MHCIQEQPHQHHVSRFGGVMVGNGCAGDGFMSGTK